MIFGVGGIKLGDHTAQGQVFIKGQGRGGIQLGGWVVGIEQGNNEFFFDGCIVFVLGLYAYSKGAGIGFVVEGSGGFEGTVGFEGEEVVVVVQAWGRV